MTGKKAEKLLEKYLCKIPIYDYEVYIIPNRKHFEKLNAYCYKDDLTIEDVTDGCCRKYYKENGGQFALLGVFSNDNYETIAHECIHTALYIMEYIGQEVSSGDETLPYLTEYLIKEVKKRINNA